MTTPVTCSVFVDDQWLADGGQDPDFVQANPQFSPRDSRQFRTSEKAGYSPDPRDPTALSGLAITWGRSTTVDQPQSASCTFDVMDLAGGVAFLDRLKTGSTVQVYATGRTWPPPDHNTIPDPSFEARALGAAPAGWVVTGGQVRVSAAAAHTGSRAVSVVASAAVVTALIPPGLWASPDTPPGSWDLIPRAQLGQDWSLSIWGRRPTVAAAALAVGPAWITGPVRQWTAPHPGTPVPLTAAWAQAAQVVTVGPDDTRRWVGATVQITGALGPSWADLAAAGPGPSWADYPAGQTWDDHRTTYLDDVAALAPDGPRDDRVLVFAGRITDLDAGWDDALAAPVVSVIAQDFLAELAQRDIGDVPWPAESILARAGRIVARSGLSIEPVYVDADVAAVIVSAMDVDNQPADQLLADLATSADAVLWAAAHQDTGPFLWVQSGSRVALLTLARGPDGQVVIVTAGPAAASIRLSACDVLLAPVTWRQAVADVTTRVALRWLDQTKDEHGRSAPTERTEMMVDAALEAQMGTNRLGVGTLLTTLSDARTIGGRYLARLRRQDWRVSGLTWRTDADGGTMTDDQVATALALLDGSGRLGSGLVVTDLPAWSPGGSTVPTMLEGGTYTYEDGQWTLALTVSSARGRGGSIPWSKLDPTYRWSDMARVAWSDLIGVSDAAPQQMERVTA